ncbi:adenylosuccinate synthetase [Halolamina pelagica]|uniref:Adenylosuccinate synthetase n=1 Tax=Halolamina pelagica TaxID=699431 RepID=A0A0P7HUW1_9EURY|nr:adenylosuccinate synthetase [Halolamina pelagica]
MPTEFEGETATTLREAAGEFGTVTGRPRRVGWLDLPMLRHATRVNGYTGITLGHLDALAALDDLQVCTAYELDGERIETPPPSAEAWARCVPQYERFDSWADQDWQAVADRGYEALPETAKAYTEFVSDDLGVPVYAIGVGPDREATIVCENPIVEATTAPTSKR